MTAEAAAVPEDGAAHRPGPGPARPLARVPARRALAAAGVVTAVGLVAGTVVSGAEGLVGALVAGALLGLLFGGGVGTDAVASRVRRSRLAAVTLGGLAIRFLAYTGTLWAVAATGVADLLVVAAVTVVGLTAALAVELRAALARGRGLQTPWERQGADP